MEYKKTKIVPILGYLYLIIPNLIFFIGWLKWYYALAISLLFVGLGFFLYKKIKPIDTVLPKTWKEYIIIFLAVLLLTILIIFSGIGNNSGQTADLYVRNTIFKELVENDWPVLKIYGEGASQETRYLVYYIGHFLPAALLGKLFGLYFGFAFLAMWSLLGLIIVYLLICSYYKKVCFFPLFVFTFFTGITMLFNVVFRSDLLMQYYSLGDFQYSYFLQGMWFIINNQTYALVGNFAHISWTFNQSIPVFVAVALLFIGGQKHDIVFMTGLLVISSTLTCLGLALIIIALVFLKEKDDDLTYGPIKSMDDLLINLKRYVLNPGFLLGIVTAVFTGLYVISNSNVGAASAYTEAIESSSGFSLPISFDNPFVDKETFIGVLFFLLFDLIIYVIYCFKYEKKNILFYVAIFSILFFLPMRFNYRPDIMLKAPQVAYCLLAFYFINSLYKDRNENHPIRLSIGISIFAISLLTPIIDIGYLLLTSFNLYNYNEITDYAVKQYIYVSLIVLALFIVIYALSYIKKTPIKIGVQVASIVGIIFIVTLMVSHVTEAGMTARVWNEIVGSDSIYQGMNFSGNGESFFFQHLASR